jgi:hypothetical protein
LAEGVKVVCHIASDKVVGGRLAAQAISAAIKGNGKVATIDHPEVESIIQRVHGFEEEAAKFAGIKVVAKLSGHGIKDQAFRTTEDIIRASQPLYDYTNATVAKIFSYSGNFAGSAGSDIRRLTGFADLCLTTWLSRSRPNLSQNLLMRK